MGKILKGKGVNVGYIKPIESGGVEDTTYAKTELELSEDLGLLNPINLKNPLSPNIAAAVEDVEININKIKESFQKLKESHEYLIVEGAGGVCVPIKTDYLMADLIKDLKLPCVLVTRPDLGTINHTILSVEYLRNKGILVKGVIINCIDELKDVPYYEETFKAIEEFGHVEIIGVVKNKDDYSINIEKLL
ncbi:MAG: dethiobiotin synthase [Methanococcus maripaludis]|uniref:ATP-dependent dethiobiotin synthetase BioD n=1 Tax=Methanococcus maripaludis TaxID=39152 RepID=A0A8T3VZ13_METMI|nr:dethiobiotin synthase [Methanococcus maripaludis]